jgi:hypothetical protein
MKSIHLQPELRLALLAPVLMLQENALPATTSFVLRDSACPLPDYRYIPV